MSIRTCAACGDALIQRDGWKVVSGRRHRLETSQAFEKRLCCDDKCRLLLQLQTWNNPASDEGVAAERPAWTSTPGPRNYARVWR